MLRAHAVRPGGHGYYVEDLVPGRAEHSPVAGEDPGLWSGPGADDLGLAGVVEAGPFAAVIRGCHPGTGEPLGRGQGARRLGGFDLTFGAPKSVSILHLLAPGELATEVGRGHAAAVDDAMAYLSRSGTGVRRVRDARTTYLPAVGPVAARFVHRTSRALDPHLHTHVVVANAVCGIDGAWSALDSRRLHRHLPAAQALYHARLRHELTARLGAAWEVRPSGLGDVVGVDPVLRGLFSQRTRAMDEHDQRRGARARPAGRHLAAIVTRPDKDRSVTVDDLRAGWRTRVADLGIELHDLTRVVGKGRDAAPGQVDPERLRLRLGRLEGVAPTVGPRHLVAAVAVSSPAGATADQVRAVAARLAERSGAPLSRGVPSTGVEPRWSTARVLETVRDPGVAELTRLPGAASGRDRGQRAGPAAGRWVGQNGPGQEPARFPERAPDRPPVRAPALPGREGWSLDR